MEFSLKRHPFFPDLYGVATRLQVSATSAARRKFRCVSFFQSTRCHFIHGFGKLVCIAKKTCEDDVLRAASMSSAKIPAGRLGELI
jgi:hypothetical protein